MVKRYQGGNQNPYIEEEQTTQWPKDTKGVIRIVYRRRTDNTMVKRRTDNIITKRRKDNIMTNRRTDNIMTKRRTDNIMTKRRIFFF
jgi:hypothetical protein